MAKSFLRPTKLGFPLYFKGSPFCWPMAWQAPWTSAWRRHTVVLSSLHLENVGPFPSFYLPSASFDNYYRLTLSATVKLSFALWPSLFPQYWYLTLKPRNVEQTRNWNLWPEVVRPEQRQSISGTTYKGTTKSYACSKISFIHICS